MPCNSDYLNPTTKEAELQRVAKLIVHVCKRLGQVPSPSMVADAENQYCTNDHVWVLCAKLNGIDEVTRELIIYDPYDRTSRDLANWWEDHQAADIEREQAEAAQAEADQKRAFFLQRLFGAIEANGATPVDLPQVERR